MSDTRQAEIGLLGGTGVYGMEDLEDVRDVDIETPYGAPSSPVRLGRFAGRDVAFIARHGFQHQLLPTEVPYHANVHALKQLGVSKVLAVGAVGSLVEELPPRSLVVPDQLFDRTRHRPNTFFGDGVVCHVSMADPFSDALRTALLSAAAETGHPAHDGGTYVCMEGPQFSTRSESHFYRSIGGTVIGMTNLTEARLCREAEIGFASLSLVTDYDCWREGEAGVDAAEILAVLRDNAHVAKDVLCAAVPLVPTGSLPENDVLRASLVTPLEAIPVEVRERLGPILGTLFS